MDAGARAVMAAARPARMEEGSERLVKAYDQLWEEHEQLKAKHEDLDGLSRIADERDRLKDQLAECNQRVEHYENFDGTLSAERDRLKDQLAEAERREQVSIEDANRGWAAAKTMEDELGRARAGFHATIADWAKKHAEAVNDVQRLAEELDAVAHDAMAQSDRNVDMANDAVEMGDELARLAEENDDLREKYESAKAMYNGPLTEENKQLRKLLTADPEVEWQAMAKLVFDAEEEVEQLRRELQACRSGWPEGSE